MRMMKTVCFLLFLLSSAVLFGAESPKCTVIINEGKEQNWHRLVTTSFSSTEVWVEKSVTFTAPVDEKIQLLLNSSGGLSWIDTVSVVGAAEVFSNGSFEDLDDKGAPTGWSFGKSDVKGVTKDGALAQDGIIFLKLGKEYLQHWISVKAGQEVTVRFFIKCPIPVESEESLQTARSEKSGEEMTESVMECTPRNGLPHFFKLCREGQDVAVAYLGGSITSQKGWRVHSLALFQKLYPTAKFQEIYAAIGGTGADLGAYRLEHDVIQQKPDLLFVEFATNGGQCESMEGIVRGLWNSLPECDICFVNTVAGQESQTLLEQGKLNRNAAAYETVAEHYGIPTINMGLRAAELAREGKLAWKEQKAKVEYVAGAGLDQESGVQRNPDGRIPFAADGVHPYLDTGHILYTEAIERSIPSLKAASKVIAPHSPLPEPLCANYVLPVSFSDVSVAPRIGEWRKSDSPETEFYGFGPNRTCPDLKTFLPSVWVAKPGSSMTFKCTGKMLMLYTVSGPGSGAVEIEADGKKVTLNVFDAWCNVWRLAPVFFRFKTPHGVHSVTVTVSEKTIDKRAIFAKLGREKQYDAKVDEFQGQDLVIGGICIEGGEIVE